MTSKAVAAKRRGRPPKPRDQVKRGAIWFRVTEAKQARLEREAQASGRSVAQEAEFRIEQSYPMADIHGWLFGGTINAEEVLSLRQLWQALRVHVDAIAGDTGPDYWQRFMPAVIRQLPAVIEQEFLRQMQRDLAEHGPPHLVPKAYRQESGQPSRAIFEAKRRHYWERAHQLLEAEPALRPEFPDVWDVAQKVPVTFEEKEALLDRFIQEED